MNQAWPGCGEQETAKDFNFGPAHSLERGRETDYHYTCPIECVTGRPGTTEEGAQLSIWHHEGFTEGNIWAASQDVQFSKQGREKPSPFGRAAGK